MIYIIFTLFLLLNRNSHATFFGIYGCSYLVWFNMQLDPNSVEVVEYLFRISLNKQRVACLIFNNSEICSKSAFNLRKMSFLCCLSPLEFESVELTRPERIHFSG